MKYTLLTIFSFLSIGLFGNGVDPIHNTKTIKTETSTVIWTGKKVTGSHTGTINIKDGALVFHSGKLVGGTVNIDMTSIACTDLGERGAGKLEGHLKSDDFFGVPNHPVASFKITNVTASKTAGESSITGDFTIKGITKSITFNANVYANNATASLNINRTDFDIRYGSGSFFDDLGDKTIDDEFILDLSLDF